MKILRKKKLMRGNGSFGCEFGIWRSNIYVSHQIALTLIYSCVHGQIYSRYFLQAKLGHHKVKDVRKGFEDILFNSSCLIA